MKAPIENVDFGLTADDYLKHRAGFPNSLFHRLAATGSFTQKRIVDLGTGTGTMARGLAHLGNAVTGIDPAQSMLEAAKSLTEESLNIQWQNGTAEATGLANHSADIVAAGQCWHWFEADDVCNEIKRILVPDGMVVIAYYDWLPIGNNMVRQTEKLIEQHNPAWKGGNGHGIHPDCFTDLALGGFTNLASFTYDEPAVYSHEGWRGRIRASAGVSASLPPEQVAVFDRELANLMADNFPDEPMQVPHRVFVVTAQCH